MVRVSENVKKVLEIPHYKEVKILPIIQKEMSRVMSKKLLGVSISKKLVFVINDSTLVLDPILTFLPVGGSVKRNEFLGRFEFLDSKNERCKVYEDFN